jgi:soluble lytic murein transglycosylase
MNYEKLEANLHKSPERKPKKTRVRPKISDEKVTNWNELRADSLGHLIKTFAHSRKATLRAVKEAALAETQCPNTPAIALAATLEDDLPATSDFSELGRLYEKGGECLTDPDDRENVLTRAGLFYYVKKEVPKAVAIWLKSSQIEAAKSPRPFYWLYRAQIESGDKPGASATLAKLKDKFPFSFHTVIARLKESQDPDDVLVRDLPAPAFRSKKVTVASTLVEEAELLRACAKADAPSPAVSKVLDWAIEESKDAEPEFRLYLAELKAEGGEVHSAIFVLSKILIDYPRFVSRKTLELYFPKAFLALFQKEAQGLDPFLLLSVARQESAFNPRAVSAAHAKGLLQLVGRHARRRRGQSIFDPETNIRAGAKLINQMLAENEGRLSLALGAYNAGPRKVGLWLKRYPTGDPVLFIDLIPYKETRAYVALILRNYYWYRRMYNPGEHRIPWAAMNERERALWPDTPSVATSAVR